MPDAPLANESGQIDKEALRARINAALNTAEQPRPLRHFTIARVGSDVKVSCWCGKARLLSVAHINVFCKQFNDFLYEHSWCEPGDVA